MIKFYDEITKVGKMEIATKAMSKKEIKDFIDSQVNHYGLTIEKNYRKICNKLTEEDNLIYSKKNQKPVQEIIISIEWKKSAMWGYNPRAESKVSFFDGTFERRSGYTCSGCGYDKESTVIAQIFNDFLIYRLYNLQGRKKAIEKIPYGAYVDFKKNWIRFNGGVGTSCYYGLSEALGGSFERVSSGDSFDVFKVTFKKEY